MPVTKITNEMLFAGMDELKRAGVPEVAMGNRELVLRIYVLMRHAEHSTARWDGVGPTLSRPEYFPTFTVEAETDAVAHT